MKNTLFTLLLLACSHLGAWATSDSSSLILRSTPYLQNPTDGGITLCWQTHLPCHSYVEWGEDSTNLQRAHTLIAGQVIANNTTNKIRLQGVQGGKTYYYRIVSRHIRLYQAYKKEFGGTYRSPLYHFTLPAPNEKNFDALIFNDLHQKLPVMDTLMDRVVRAKKLKYDLVVFNGDCIDDPKNEEQAISTMHHFNTAVGSPYIPVLYMRGNHEIRNAYSMDLTRLFEYPANKSYGALNWGDTRLVLLDCGEDKPDDHWVYYGLNDFSGFRAEQLDFLTKEHQSAAFKAAKKRILIHHIPLWGLDETYNPSLELWGKELSEQPYNLAVNGHTHQARYHKTGEKGNPFPILVGGGNNMASATVVHLSKRGNKLTMRCYNSKGELLFSSNL